jgi:hypothetical protein
MLAILRALENPSEAGIPVLSLPFFSLPFFPPQTSITKNASKRFVLCPGLSFPAGR